MRLRGKAVTRACALFAGVAMVAAACGGSDGDEVSSEDTIDQSVNEALNEQLNETDDTDVETTEAAAPAGDEPTSMEEWEALWETERAAMVERIKSEGWGVDAAGTKLSGPEGFEIDLSACPAGWDNTEGLTDSDIKIGQTLALSGTLADYGNYGQSIDALMKYYSDKGMFKDAEAGVTRKVNYIQKD
ncbi:MAG: hypothetical protein OEY23_20685, partial [Acidimicrobiia bacterium]|nr:hypothetical protein [Acidimicrobiia bacterium]